ncbi:nucleoside-diphosphate sugar epimerase/dehydratase [Paractinoplanes durhamensis]|uniref:nucleoside-diphosphate sugar epimerase/dehydratase n=1 Tax=Paractinoplanes durhamensis TaxID=113563 RepID=UPI0036385BB9
MEQPVIPAPRRSPEEPPTERIIVDGGNSRSTVVLPYIPSAKASRTRPLRAWMLALPIDLAALLAPITWSQQFWKGTVAVAVITVGAFMIGGLYRARRHLSVLDELPQIYFRFLAATAAVAIVVAGRHNSINYIDGFLRLAGISAVLLLPARAISRAAVLYARRKRLVEHSAIIVGGGPIAIELARLLRRYPQYGLRFAGFVDVPSTAHNKKESMPLVGEVESLEELVRYTECDVVIIADIDCSENRLLRAVRAPGMARTDLWMVPRLREFPGSVGSPTTSAPSRSCRCGSRPSPGRSGRSSAAPTCSSPVSPCCCSRRSWRSARSARSSRAAAASSSSSSGSVATASRSTC